MKRRTQRFLPATLVLLCGLLAWWFASGGRAAKPAAAPLPAKVAFTPKPVPAPRPVVAAPRDEFPDGTTVEAFASCNEGEVILRFPSDESYGSFLHALGGSPVRLLGRLDRLQALRLGYGHQEDLEALLDGENITTYDSLSRFPAAPRPGGGAAADALGFGDEVLPWLGIDGDNSRWGAGVKVAILDSGILPHPALPSEIRSIEIIPFPDDPGETEGHGTAVASLVAGNGGPVRGVAPAAELISVRIVDERGTSDAFAIAAGILAAMDAGAQLINLSLGTTDDIPLIAAAVVMAQQAGIVIVASSGNDGAAEASFPASYAGVISVGAVDATRRRLAFSNLGSWLSLTAPGHLVDAAWSGGRVLRMSGTSASAPLVCGAIAAAMSDGSGQRLDAATAARWVVSLSDDAGAPGQDPEYGAGILNVARVINRGIPNLQDAAIVSQRLVTGTAPGNPLKLDLTIQNRGTAILINPLVEIRMAGYVTPLTATTLAPGAVHTFSVPVQQAVNDRQITVSSSVAVARGEIDIHPENNTRTDRFFLR
ncbi:S8 family peptidase [Luteolibacter marinus]|uniref:S8 family peptidase n=1 Tax=Luteolibacter marinus TaxID=2776705 RepID=UPI001866BC5E|nr:S8 family serine peptidase [Luteolibacter marinus]